MAGMFSQNFIEKVIDASDIVSIISEHTNLKQSGPRYIGLCPFHNEKTPSFTVNGDKKLYYCFGCQRGGNVVSFVMEMFKYSFPEAIEYLAERANIPIERVNTFDDNTAYVRKKRLFQINKDAANFYYLAGRKNEKAISYIKKRGVSASSLKTFGIGYAPGGRSVLYSYLKEKGYSDKELIESALVRKNETKGYFYDYFSDRLMFPIQNVSDNIVAFGGRRFDNSQPKYLNSPETSVFVKHATLFNLNRAKNKLASKPLIVVEGYMDVVSLFDKGIENVCATLGTALNAEHAKLMMKYTRNIILCYDADEAGQNAAMRGLGILVSQGLNPRVLTLEKGEDPDSYVLKYGKEAFEQKAAEAKYSTDYKIDYYKNRYDLSDIVQLAEFTKKACEAAAETRDEIKWDYYVKIISSLTGTDPLVIKKQIYKSSKYVSAQSDSDIEDSGNMINISVPQQSKSTSAELIALKYILKGQSYFERFVILGGDKSLFSNEDAADLYDEIKRLYEENGNVDISNNLVYNNKLAQTVVSVDNAQDISSEGHLKDIIKTLRLSLYEGRLRQIKKRIDETEKNCGKVDAALLKEYGYLKKELIKIKSEVNII